MKYYKLTLEVFKGYNNEFKPTIAPAETEKAYVLETSKYKRSQLQRYVVYLPKSICKVEFADYGDHYWKATVYIPCWWFRAQGNVMVGELIGANNFYSKYEVVEF